MLVLKWPPSQPPLPPKEEADSAPPLGRKRTGGRLLTHRALGHRRFAFRIRSYFFRSQAARRAASPGGGHTLELGQELREYIRAKRSPVRLPVCSRQALKRMIPGAHPRGSEVEASSFPPLSPPAQRRDWLWTGSLSFICRYALHTRKL